MFRWHKPKWLSQEMPGPRVSPQNTAKSITLLSTACILPTAHTGTLTCPGKRQTRPQPSTGCKRKQSSLKQMIIFHCSKVQFWHLHAFCRCFWWWIGVSMGTLTSLSLCSPTHSRMCCDTFCPQPSLRLFIVRFAIDIVAKQIFLCHISLSVGFGQIYFLFYPCGLMRISSPGPCRQSWLVPPWTTVDQEPEKPFSVMLWPSCLAITICEIHSGLHACLFLPHPRHQAQESTVCLPSILSQIWTCPIVKSYSRFICEWS